MAVHERHQQRLAAPDLDHSRRRRCGDAVAGQPLVEACLVGQPHVGEGGRLGREADGEEAFLAGARKLAELIE